MLLDVDIFLILALSLKISHINRISMKKVFYFLGLLLYTNIFKKVFKLSKGDLISFLGVNNSKGSKEGKLFIAFNELFNR